MKKLRWGLLSTARINEALLSPIRTSDRNELIAVASRDLKKAHAYAHERGIPKVFGSYEAMLSDSNIDVIYISLPNSMHAEWTIKAIQAGKHVLCEKPLALTVQDVDAIAEAAQKAGVVVMEALMYRYHPQTIRVKALVDSGAIGKLQILRGSFTFKISSESDARLNPTLGGGSIWDIGCYPISYSHLIVGNEPVKAFGWQIIGTSGVDELFIGQLNFPGDVYAQFDCGFRTPLRTHMELVGDEGTITIAHPFSPGFNEEIILTNGGRKQVIPIQGAELYIGEVENITDSILHGKVPGTSLADSRSNIATIKALLYSAQEGKPIIL